MPTDFEEQVKRYYRHTEDYDWTQAMDTFRGLETIFHRARCKETLRLAKQFGRRGHYLDVGCGTAMITRFLGEQIVGLDLNPRHLQKARQYVPQGKFVLCDVEGTIPLHDQSFDVAICTEMLEHLLYPLQAVSEIHRVLKPNGVLVGSVPGRSPIWKLRWTSNSRESFTEEPYHKHYRREEVKTLLSRYFHLQKLYSKHFQMNWFFVASKGSLLEGRP
jgi:SAM-dependent methyltransferase